MTAAREDFIAAVRSLVGTPVRHQGRIAGQASDCVGVPVIAMLRCGIPVQDSKDYQLMPSAGALIEALQRHADEVKPWDAMPGDLLALMWKGEPRHVAVDVGCGLIVHAKASMARVVMEPLRRAHRVASRWRIRGLV